MSTENEDAEKYDIEPGDTITLVQPYDSGKYTFKVSGIYDYPSAIAIFMQDDYFDEVFDKQEGSFNGYFSNDEITDIDESLISTVITLDDLDKTCRQLKLSIGSNMKLLQGFGIIMFALIIYEHIANKVFYSIDFRIGFMRIKYV